MTTIQDSTAQLNSLMPSYLKCLQSCCPCFPCIFEAEAGVVEYCGRFEKVIPPGCTCICFPFENVVQRMSLKVRHLDIKCDTKTKDNVFVSVVIAVQYRICDDKVSSAHYKLTDSSAQIRSYVYDVVRSSIPTMNVDDTFSSKEDVAHAVRDRLSVLMAEYGYEIIAVLVVDIEPDKQVKEAMNEINASQRLREAAAEKAEAEKILKVKAAEAEAESKYLNGLGIARQRKAIVDGLRDTVNDFSEHVPGTGPKDVMDLLLMTQYFEMLRDLGRGGGNNSLFLPHGPQAVGELREVLHKNFMANYSNVNTSMSTAPAQGKVRLG